MDDRERIRIDLTNQPPLQRHIVMLTVYDKLTWGEISEVLEIPEDQVIELYHKAMHEMGLTKM